MTDAAIIDAYENAYTVAQQVGADGRVAEMPPMRDRQTMARRVRGYVLAGNKDGGSKTSGGAGSGTATSRERKALATMGSRGGKKAAQRWKDRDSGYAKAELAKLEAANTRRSMSGELLETRVKRAILDARTQGAKDPSTKEMASAFGVSVRRIQQVRKKLGLGTRPGRSSKSETP